MMSEDPSESGPVDASDSADETEATKKLEWAEDAQSGEGNGSVAGAYCAGSAGPFQDKQARIEQAKRRYRATVRNEADTGGGGFSEDYYRSQKPPHW